MFTGWKTWFRHQKFRHQTFRLNSLGEGVTCLSVTQCPYHNKVFSLSALPGYEIDIANKDGSAFIWPVLFWLSPSPTQRAHYLCSVRLLLKSGVAVVSPWKQQREGLLCPPCRC
ncbi:hypothetical protein DPEC_G00045070 [Dallia pectoralis]|uniref:Uncharacterized protein n=1 Tax=Dallia pectoralis TaxID=75939 RepID=A0ACC2HA04_DALPE|nr:hypothetical protein DPEC_G00045070 [Dallia pectoralis]